RCPATCCGWRRPARRCRRRAVLQVHGATDPCLLESTARDSRRWVTGPYTHRVLDTGHFTHQERPAEVTESVLGHLRHPPRG
ncbi:alpha/beta fold hydrolase, partial [Pseudonocardia pini]|uniref:alpha/beta fold hydrolase n=1 Tax=Pseudonocardia pini TaxID=2758030 RepID=UPI001C690D74